MIHWLSQADGIGLIEENYSFNELAVLWMEDLWRSGEYAEERSGDNRLPLGQRWSYARKFLDYLEANAGEYWRVPRLESFAEAAADLEDQPEEEAEFGDEGENLYDAAYEQLTYRDSTDDGIDSSLFEAGPDADETRLVYEAERIVGRLSFLAMVSHLWKMSAAVSLYGDLPDGQRDEVLAGWRRSSCGQLPRAAGIAGLGVSLSRSSARRQPRIDGRVRPPPRREGDAAGEHH